MAQYFSAPAEQSGPGESYEAITKSDTVGFSFTSRAIYVGGTGDVVAVTPGGTAVTFSSVPAGALLPIKAIRVNSTSTTATNMVAIF